MRFGPWLLLIPAAAPLCIAVAFSCSPPPPQLVAHPTWLGAPVASSAALLGSAGPGTPSVLCAPVFGPLESDIDPRWDCTSKDGLFEMRIVTRGDAKAVVELVSRGTVIERADFGDWGNPDFMFRGQAAFGLAAVDHGGFGSLAWATTSPPKLHVVQVDGAAEDGSRVYFSARGCRLQALELDSATTRTLPVRACDSLRVWSDGLAIGEPVQRNGIYVGATFGKNVVEPRTWTRVSAPCPHRIGGACVWLGTDGGVSVSFGSGDEGPPGPSSEELTVTLGGVVHKGWTKAALPHLYERSSHPAPAHPMLWKNASGTALAVVASELDGVMQDALVVIESDKLRRIQLSSDEASDLRKLKELSDFVPFDTKAENVARLLKMREAARRSVESVELKYVTPQSADSAYRECSSPKRVP